MTKPDLTLIRLLLFWVSLTFSQFTGLMPGVASEIEAKRHILRGVIASTQHVCTPSLTAEDTSDSNDLNAVENRNVPCLGTSHTPSPTAVGDSFSPPSPVSADQNSLSQQDTISPNVEPWPTSPLDPSPGEDNPNSNSPDDSTADPELGTLRLRELPKPPTPAPPTVYLLGRIGYLNSENLFARNDPVEDGLVRLGASLVVNPALGSQTSLLAGVHGNIIRYSDRSEFDYDELKFNVGIRQQLTPRTYTALGWWNRQLFTEEGGDRFLNDHSVYLELGRSDRLIPQLSLNSFYQLRVSFAEPDSRSQWVNSIGLVLAYTPDPAVQIALNYQYSLITFTGQDRQDEYHQLIARLTYTLSPRSQIYLFGGESFGGSSTSAIDFDGLVLGIGLNFNVPLF